MAKKNLLVIAVALVVIALVAWVGLSMPQQRSVTKTSDGDGAVLAVSSPQAQDDASGQGEVTAAPTATETPQETAAAEDTEDTAQQGAETQEAKAYLLVTVNGILYEPIPLLEERDYSITQRNGEVENVVHVTTDSIEMASSTCENQDCVMQGVVTLENRDTRVLQDMIVCLPNGVILELITPQEAAEIMQNSGAQ